MLAHVQQNIFQNKLKPLPLETVAVDFV